MHEYHFWEQALENPDAIGKTIKTDENSPQPGFYRTKDGHPVAIWRDSDGFLVMLRGDDLVGERDTGDVWLRCLNRPVSEDHYNMKRDLGVWHDENTAVSATTGHNIKNSDDPADIATMIADLVRAADALKIDDDDTAAQAQSIRARLNELGGKADKLREVEKAPSLEAGRKIDKKWQPMIKEADAGSKKMRAAIGKWEDAKREAERKRQAEIEAARIAAEEAGRPAPEPEPEPQNEAPRARVSGAYGRAASVRVRVVAVAITDGIAVYKRYRNNPDVIALLLKLAQRDIDSDIAVDGIETEERADVR